MTDYSELKRLAEAATPGRIHDRLDSCGGGLKYTCSGDDGSVVLKVDHKNDYFGFIGNNRVADEAFFLKCTPAAVLALIAEAEGLRAQHGRDGEELRRLCQTRDDARKESNQLRVEVEALRKNAGHVQSMLSIKTVEIPKEEPPHLHDWMSKQNGNELFSLPDLSGQFIRNDGDQS